MTKFLFEKCCFLVELRIGCFILAYIEAILTALGAIMYIVLIYQGITGSNISVDKKKKDSGFFLLAVFISYMILYIGGLAFAIVLVIALHKDKLEDVKSYLMFGVFYLICIIIVFMVDMVCAKFRLLEFFVTNIGILFKLYAMLITRSYYYEMQGEEGV